MPWALSPARSANSAWLKPAAKRCLRNASPNVTGVHLTGSTSITAVPQRPTAYQAVAVLGTGLRERLRE